MMFFRVSNMLKLQPTVLLPTLSRVAVIVTKAAATLAPTCLIIREGSYNAVLKQSYISHPTSITVLVCTVLSARKQDSFECYCSIHIIFGNLCISSKSKVAYVIICGNIVRKSCQYASFARRHCL